MDFLGTISSQWGFFALVFYMIFNEWAKNRKKKESENVTLARHLELEKKVEDLEARLMGDRILLMIYNQPLKEAWIDKMFNEYSPKHNGVVADAYYEWKEKRNNSKKNLKNRNNEES